MNNLAGAYFESGRPGKASRFFELNLQDAERNLGIRHAGWLAAASNLVAAYDLAGRSEDALKVCNVALSAFDEDDETLDSRALNIMCVAANSSRELGRHDDALRLSTQARNLAEQTLPPDHKMSFITARILGTVYRDAGRVDEAISLLKETIARQKEVDGPQHPRTLSAMHHLALAYSQTQQLDLAIKIMQEVVDGRRKVLPPEHPRTLDSVLELGTFHLAQNQYTAAEPLLLEAHRGFAKRKAADPTPYDKQKVNEVLHDLVQLYEKSEQAEEAASWQKKLDSMKTNGGNDDVND